MTPESHIVYQAAAHQAAIDSERDADDAHEVALFRAERTIKAEIARPGSNISALLYDEDVSTAFVDGLDRVLRLWADGESSLYVGYELASLLDATVERAAAIYVREAK